MKQINTLLFFLICSMSYGQIITEIMYNPPESGSDSLEYVEFYNNTGAELNLENYYTSGVEITFGPELIAADAYFVIAKSRNAFDGVFQAPTYEWLDGSLNNGGEEIAIYSPDSMLVNAVLYNSQNPWPENADGLGYSLELCDLAADNTNPNNWGFSTTDTGMMINGIQVFGSPTDANQADCSIVGTEYTGLAINEIMYNTSVDGDSLQYIEIYNFGVDTVSMTGWTLGGDIQYDFQPLNILPNGYYTIAKDDDAIASVFNTASFSWSDGQTLNKTEGTIQLVSNLGTVIREVTYNSATPWPTVAEGTAIALCDLSGDQSNASSWVSSTSQSLNDPNIFGSPFNMNLCGGISIGDITEIDSSGVLVRLGETVTTSGNVYGINMRPSGLQFTIIDDANNGVGVFSFDDSVPYTVNQGDNVTITGEVAQFNGFAQISPSSITLNSQGNLLHEPTEVTSLGEDTESQLIKFLNMSIVDPSQWTGMGSGFNADISNGVDTITMRIDSDVQLIYGQNYPTGTFSVTGLGGQFDNSNPFDSGYQILPRFFEDIDPYVPFVPVPDTYPARTIEEMTSIDSTGVVDSLNVLCSLTGTVYGVNLSTNDLVFTVIDDNNNGIGVFENGAFTYEVLEGDVVTLKGSIGQFNGLTQMLPDSIILESQGNNLISPTEVTAISEDTESSLVTIRNVMLVDTLDWFGDGSSFNVEFTDGTVVHTIRIDNDTYWASQPALSLTESYDIIGIGGQFDSSDPYTEGYQLFPRYESDIRLYDPNVDLYPSRTIEEMTTIDSLGAADSLDVACTLVGTVYGVNLSGSDLIMTVIDDNNNGIGVFDNDNMSGYTVTEGDIVSIQGTIGQFNGLTQIYPVSIVIESQGNDLIDPDEVTAISEDTESSLVTLKNVTLVDASAWSGDGSSFNVEFTDGTNVHSIRIDNDTYWADQPAPMGASFDVVGLGGQFDSSEPYDSGYQLFPRYEADIVIFDPSNSAFPPRTIAEVTIVDPATGVADSIGVACTLTGTVYGVNLSGSDLIMTVIDDNNNGIGVFENDNLSGYTVTEGDIVTMEGTIGQFNGLTQINPETITLISQGNDLVVPDIVTSFGEDTESSLIEVQFVDIVDATQWAGDGSSFNLDVVDVNGNTFVVRIDNDTELANMPIPNNGATSGLYIRGIGGQFDSSDPFDSGYQLLPRYEDDFGFVLSTFNSEFDKAINIAPNPVTDFLLIRSDVMLDSYIIYNALGQMVKKASYESTINVSDLPEGNYSVLFQAEDKLSIKKFIKIN